MTELHLASKLLTLPLFVAAKIDLWLTYKGLKPASIVTLTKGNGSFTSVHQNKILNWAREAGLHYHLTPSANKDRNNLIVSKDPQIVAELFKMTPPLSDEGQVRLGTLLGYPPEAAKAYGHDFNSLIGSNDSHSPVKDLPESMYANYMLRKNHEAEDLQIAKAWMETIRKDIPKLAGAYEKIARTN